VADRLEGAVATQRRCLDEVDKRLGVSRQIFSGIWWTVAFWNACAVFNIWSRTQQWGFALPFAPDFEKTATPYAIAAIGGLVGGPILWFTLLALRFHALQWGRCSAHWHGRIPTVWPQVEAARNGQLIPLIQGIGLAVTIGFPLAGQVHFADKFLVGTSRDVTGAIYAGNWHDHLMKWISPVSACRDFIYDNRDSFAYCEFYEPWAVCIFAVVSFFISTMALHAVFFGAKIKKRKR